MNNLLSQFRGELDEFMELDPQSPLSEEQRAAFSGLNYYDENPDLLLTVAVDRLPAGEPLIEMETSTGDMRNYRRWGTFDFVVGGEAATLTIYSDPQAEDFFVPFRDATSGDETYGAGRYLDNHRPGIARLGETEFEIDFNFAYNPYCAYSAYYSCPLPPRENWLQVPIRAGEKAFAKD